MKTKLLLLLICLSASLSFAQGIRVGDSLPLQTTAVIQGTTVIVPVGIASIQMCNAPANATPCTNKATTYTDRTLGTPCSTATQVVLAGTTTCVTNSDSIGNWGVWVASGNYEWTFTNSSGASFGPYPVTANSSPNVGAWSSLTNPTANLTLAMGSNTTNFTWTPGGPTNNSRVFTFAPKGLGNSQWGGLSILGAGEVVLGNDVAGLVNPLAITMQDAATAVQNKLICVDANGAGTLCGIGNTSGALVGICAENCPSAANLPLTVAIQGVANCAFDNAATSGHWVIVSTTIAGDCHDAGTTTVPATTLSTVGRALFTFGSATTGKVLLQISR